LVAEETDVLCGFPLLCAQQRRNYPIEKGDYKPVGVCV
jgi:hypothetical protein